MKQTVKLNDYSTIHIHKKIKSEFVEYCSKHSFIISSKLEELIRNELSGSIVKGKTLLRG